MHDAKMFSETWTGIPGSTRSSGYPIILGLVFRTLWPSGTIMYLFNIIVGTLDIFLVFVLLMTMFKKAPLALLGSFFFATDPNILQYSNTLAVNSLYFFFMLLSFIVFFNHKKDLKLIYLGILLFSFTSFIRAEFLPVSIVFSLILISRVRNGPKKAIVLLLFLLMILPPIFYMTRLFNPVTQDALNDLSFIQNAPNLLSVKRIMYRLGFGFLDYFRIFYALGILIPIVLLGIIPLKRDFKSFKNPLMVLSSWFILANVIYILTRLDYKYLRLSYLPVSIFLSFMLFLGLWQINRSLHRFSKGALKKYTMPILLVIIVFVQLAGAFENGRLYVPEGHVMSEIVNNIRSLDDNSYMILPACSFNLIMEVYQKNYIPYNIFDVTKVRNLLKEGKSIYFIQSQVTLNEDFGSRSDCYGNFSVESLIDNFDLNLVDSKKDINIYQLGLKKD